MKIEPLIAVKNVPQSSRFYEKVLGLDPVHGGEEYEMLMNEGKLVLQLHRRNAHEHPDMWKPNIANGNGIVLWFRTTDFEGAVSRIRDSDVDIIVEAHVNPNAQQHEIWFRDPDGYLVVVSDNCGDAD